MYQELVGSTILKEWTTPDFRNTPSTTNLEEEEIVDAPGNDGNASMPEQVKRPNTWRKTMMMTIISSTESRDLINKCFQLALILTTVPVLQSNKRQTMYEYKYCVPHTRASVCVCVRVCGIHNTVFNFTI